MFSCIPIATFFWVLKHSVVERIIENAIDSAQRDRLVASSIEIEFMFEKDKGRFCLSKEEGKKYVEAKGQFEHLKNLVDEMKEREKNKDIYD